MTPTLIRHGDATEECKIAPVVDALPDVGYIKVQVLAQILGQACCI